ncbi:MAG: hypothetical protein EOP93_01340 [Lysobacteraceae bacterium]|nr:MAG: hypothetical protein EOP93_01340 [Xanthomonadaceae bacterium]
MDTKRYLVAALLACAPLPSVQAAGTDTGPSNGIRQELADARKEVRIDLAKAKRELDTGNLRLDNGFKFGAGGSHESKRAKAQLPRAEITPQGDLLIEGHAQAIDAGQRRQLLAYRGQVIVIAKSGIDIGQRGAEVALDAVGNGSWVGLLFGAMTGSLERRIERIVKQEIEPAVRGICRQLPGMMDSQQRLSSSLPQFRPYATLEADDVANCENDIRNEFAFR